MPSSVASLSTTRGVETTRVYCLIYINEATGKLYATKELFLLLCCFPHVVFDSIHPCVELPEVINMFQSCSYTGIPFRTQSMCFASYF